jgi:hypothetical protein
MTPERILAFDAESNGLHGPAFAIGAVLLDADGTELDAFFATSPLPEQVDPWVKQYVLPHLVGCAPSHRTAREMRTAFWDWMTERSGDALVVVDCGWPVEAGLLIDCIKDDPRRQYRGPYPLHEVASLLLAAGLDPRGDYSLSVLDPEQRATFRKHHPVDDARASALVARYALGKIRQR